MLHYEAGRTLFTCTRKGTASNVGEMREDGFDLYLREQLKRIRFSHAREDGFTGERYD